MKNVFLLFFTIFFLSSCEKNIDFNLKNADDVLVVDAQIENDVAPSVVLGIINRLRIKQKIIFDGKWFCSYLAPLLIVNKQGHRE